MPSNNYVRIPKPKSNKFNLRHERLFTSKMGKAVPNLCELVCPGDVWKVNSISKTYFQSMIGTTMGSFRVYQMYFFTPLRLLHKNFEQFITGGLDGQDATPPPTINSGENGWEAGSLMDYLGYVTNYADEMNQPVKVPNFTASAFPLRAYAKVINDWFINESIDGMELPLSLEDGADTTTNTELFNAVWRPDYFVNNQPFAQRGPQITIPLGSSAPVFGNGQTGALIQTDNGDYVGGLYSANTTTSSGNGVRLTGANSTGTGQLDQPANRYFNILGKSKSDELGGALSGIYADISEVSGIDVNRLRDYIAMQTSAEVMAMSGARLIEYLLGVWGVRSSDKTLQRSQYLGGGAAPVYITEVAQTSATDDNVTPQGNLSSNGIAVNTSWGFKRRFEEFGVLLGIQVVLPDAMYFQGNRRWLNYKTRWDFPSPLFARLGEQATLEKEIFAQGDGKQTEVGGKQITDETIFGYNPRYDECRYIPSTVHGDMKTSLKHLHAARQFANPPLLNKEFMTGAPSKRIFAVTKSNVDELRSEIGFNITAYRKLPKHFLPTSFGLLYGY